MKPASLRDLSTVRNSLIDTPAKDDVLRPDGKVRHTGLPRSQDLDG
ncbi:MAG TPA: hypothetical protein VGN12_02210 [Pirellulales bacterium]